MVLKTLKAINTRILRESVRKVKKSQGLEAGPKKSFEKTIEIIGNPIRGQTTKGLESNKPKVADFHGRYKSLKPKRSCWTWCPAKPHEETNDKREWELDKSHRQP